MDLSTKPRYYANIAGVQTCVYDMAFYFGTKKDREEKEDSNLDKDVDLVVLMSPQHAKALANILNEHIQNYEKTFGEIRLEPSQVAVDDNKIKE